MGKHFSLLNFHHSSLITHFFTLIWQHHFYFHHSIFSHYSWVPHLSAGTVYLFIYFFNTQLTEANIKKKKKKANANLEKKKKVKRWSKVVAVGPLCVFNYNITIELWVMEIKNNQKLFSVSITHNSKIRKLSDGNRVMEIELLFAKQTFCYGSHHFWVMSYENRELSYQKTQSKRALSFAQLFISHFFFSFFFFSLHSFFLSCLSFLCSFVYHLSLSTHNSSSHSPLMLPPPPLSP